MKSISILLVFLFLQNFSFAQIVNSRPAGKPIIDTEMIGTWPTINGDVIMSDNGRFIAFTISNQPIGNKSLIVQDIEGKWKKVLVFNNNLKLNFFISSDNKELCLLKKDSLFLIKLGEDASVCIGGISRYILPNKKRGGEWIAYSLKDSNNDLFLLNVVSKKKIIFPDISDAFFDNNGEMLVLNTIEKDGKLQIFNLENNKYISILDDVKVGKLTSYQFDRESKQLAFIIQDPENTSVYYYKNEMKKAIKRLDQKDTILDGLAINRIKGFDKNGKWLMVELKNNAAPVLTKNPELPSVDVWSYQDMILNPQQLYRSDFSSGNNAVGLALNLSTNYKTLLNRDGLKIKSVVSGDHIIVSSDTVYEREYWWQHSPKPSDWLLSLVEGSKKLLLSGDGMKLTSQLSPNGHWTIWWDDETSSWNSYDVSNGIRRNLTEKIPSNFNGQAQYHATILNRPVSDIIRWFRSDEFFLVYDNYDIWKIDPTNKIPPVNITGGYGCKNKVELRIVYERDLEGMPMVYNGNESLLLVGFNQETKFNGFFQINLSKPGEPELLSMKPFTWFRQKSQASATGIRPVKGGQGLDAGYVLTGESATDYPNYYYTKDFKTFKPLTTLEPQRKYNWLTTELVTWNLPNGRTSQGILYKPENFDSSKKYPVIFNYYEKVSFNLYGFENPYLTTGNINIPWFVSRGYLVFCPDIYYEIGAKTGIPSGKYACLAVESAARELIKRNYIDNNKMAIDGHSFGGLETNYILTHSKLFAAAAEGSGFTDEMSTYLTLSGDGILRPLDIASAQSAKEQGHAMYGTTPWENPNLYLDNSPVWSANNASAPLLMFHNKKDDQVHWWQGVELYMAFRRLGKPCWMLQYDNSRHLLDNKKDALDYTVRLTEFFDHYLKDKYPAKWMTQSVPAKLKQVETRYELDSTYGCWKDCKVCNKLGLSNNPNF